MSRDVDSRLVACCVYDSCARFYSAPYFSRTREEAVRVFTDTVSNSGGEIFKHPDHYSLYFIGLYDTRSGLFDLSSEPDFIVKAIDVVSSAKVVR